MRVLHVSAGNLYGGVETILVTLARYRDLCPAMEPEFAVCFEGRLSEELVSLGAQVHNLGAVRASRLWSVVRARRRLRRLLKQARFDAVICHMSWAHAIFGRPVRQAGVPLLFWAHGIASGRHWLERWARWSKPVAAIANSAYTAASLNNLFDAVPAHVLYCPVGEPGGGTPSRNAMRRELGAREDTVVILQVSRMEAWKGHELHLRALAQIRDNPTWICLIAGGAQRPEETAYAERLQRMTEELGLSGRVRFLGQRSDVRDLMAASDIFCQPNQGPEPFGIVFVEALWAGLPVVTTAIGGGAEIVTEWCGALTPPDDATALARSLRELIEDSGRRALLGQAGPARARELCDPGRQLQLLKKTIGLYTTAARSKLTTVNMKEIF